MNARQFTRRNPSRLTAIFAALSLLGALLAACQPAQPTATAIPTTPPTAVVLPTQPAPQPTQAQPTQAQPAGEITLDTGGVATIRSLETVPAVGKDSGQPAAKILPEYRIINLEGYPASGDQALPQIFVYPVAELAQYNADISKIAEDLKALLASQQPGDKLPYLPFYGEVQSFHAQVQFLSFKNGTGVRYLTQHTQGIVPVNNIDLVYTFQGLTSDGKYYVSAVLPVTHPQLPSTQALSEEQADKIDQFPALMAETAAWLSQQPAESFTPSLAALDAMVQSIDVK